LKLKQLKEKELEKALARAQDTEHDQ